MQNKDLKLKRLSLALLGGAAVASPEAFAAGSTQECSTHESRGTVTETCTATPESAGETYTFLNKNLTDVGAFVFNATDRDLEFINHGEEPAAVGGDFSATSPKTVTFNLAATITSEDGKANTNGTLVTLAGNPNATDYHQASAIDVNLASNITVTNTANGKAAAVKISSDTLSANRIAGQETTVIRSNVQGAGKAYGALIDNHRSGSATLSFNNSNILADGHNQGVLSVGISTSDIDSLAGSDSAYNLSEHQSQILLDDATVEAKNSDYNIAVSGSKGLDIKGNSNIRAVRSTIKASGGKELNVGLFAANTNSLDSFNHITTNENTKNNDSNIELVDSTVTVDATSSKTILNGQGSRNFGIAAITNFEGHSDHGSTVTLNNTKIQVLNTLDNSQKAGAHLNAGVLVRGHYAFVDQDVKSSIKVTGDYNAGIYADATGKRPPHINNSGLVHLNIKGLVEAKDYGLYTKTLPGQETAIRIDSDASIYADTAIYNNEGDSNITIFTADIGKKDRKTKIELNEGYDFLTFNGTDISNLKLVDGGEGVDVQTNFDSLNIENRDTDIDGNVFKGWEHIRVNQAPYTLLNDITVGHGIHPANLQYQGGLEIDRAELKIANKNITITGDVLNRNNGLLNLQLENGEFATLTIDGDYYGGGVLRFNTALGNDESKSDRLIITGNVYGQSKVEVVNKDGEGDLTDKGIKLIQLSADSKVADKAFTLVEKKTAGDYEYSTLAHRDGADSGIYLLSHKVGTPEPTVSTEKGTSSTAVATKAPVLNLDGYEYLRALRSNTALTAFNGADLFYDHKNDKGFSTNFASRYATNQGYYNQLTLSYGGDQYRFSGAINYGKDSWSNFNNSDKSLSKTIGFTGEVAYHHADDFIFAVNLDYGHHDNQIKRSYKVAGKTNTFSNKFLNNSIAASLRLSKDFSFTQGSLTPYFVLAVQNNRVKGFSEDLQQADTTAGTYDKLVLETPTKAYTSVRPEVGLLGSARLSNVFEVKGGVSYSYLPESELSAVLVGSKAGKEVFKVAQDFNYKEDHLIAGRLALVAHFSKNLSLKVEGKANKLTSFKGVKASGELALKYNF